MLRKKEQGNPKTCVDPDLFLVLCFTHRVSKWLIEMVSTTRTQESHGTATTPFGRLDARPRRTHIGYFPCRRWACYTTPSLMLATRTPVPSAGKPPRTTRVPLFDPKIDFNPVLLLGGPKPPGLSLPRKKCATPRPTYLGTVKSRTQNPPPHHPHPVGSLRSFSSRTVPFTSCSLASPKLPSTTHSSEQSTSSPMAS